MVIEVFKSTLNDSEMIETLEHVDGNALNVFHHAAANIKHEGVAASVVETLNELLDAERCKIMMEQKSADGNNPLHILLSSNENFKCITSFISSLKSIFETPVEFKLYLRSNTDDGENVFHLIARWSSDQVLAKFLELFTAPEIVEMFMSLDKWNQNVFHVAVCYNSVFFIKAIFEHARRFPFEKLIEALKTSQIDGWNLFHYTACNKHREVAGFVLEFLTEILGKNSAIAMLKEFESKYSRNFFPILV
jgi:hypothetical protein